VSQALGSPASNPRRNQLERVVCAQYEARFRAQNQGLFHQVEHVR
jgi:hypothetical protein